MKKIKKIFILFTMLVAGLSFNSANNVEKNVVAGAADAVMDANTEQAQLSYAHLKGYGYPYYTSWSEMIVNKIKQNAPKFTRKNIKNLLITKDESKVKEGYIDGCPVEAGLTGDGYTPEAYYTNGCAVAAYVYPNATDTTMFDCILYTKVDVLYAYGSMHFANLTGVEKITIDCQLSMAYLENNEMKNMFTGNSNLVQIEGLTNITGTSAVTDMSNMFSSCKKLTTLDVSSFDTTNVTNMDEMFGWCNSVTTIKGLEKWNTTKVTSMYRMFYGCYVLTEADVSYFNTSSVTNMSSMFRSCRKLNPIDVSRWNTSNVTDMSEMFGDCWSVEKLDVSHFDTSKVTNMYYMFSSCKSLTSLNINKFDTTNVTDMACMFAGCDGLQELDVSQLNTSKVTTMESMFMRCSSLTTLDVSTFDTTNVTNMDSMFRGSGKLITIIGLENFKTSNVTTMSYMFYYCKSLTTLNVGAFDTSKVTDMDTMFGDCEEITSIKGLENWNTSSVTDMRQMFTQCRKLTEVDVSNFNTEKVTTFSNMFSYCESLTTLDLSSFDLSSITDKNQLGSFLYGTSSLTEIEAPSNLNGYSITLNNTFGMTEIDPTMEGWTLLQGSKEFNILYNTLLRINVCTEYARASELQAMYDGLINEEKEKLATLTDDGGVILTDKLSYMVSYADYKANEATAATSGTHLVLSAKTSQYLVLVIACLSLSLIGGYYFIQKKKYAK